MMNDVQLRAIDLNLLVVFEVLMDELSVARAADRLGRTPSAVSHALARLRETFGDPLLVKAGGRMKPSPTALALIDEVRPILRRVHRLVQPPEVFDAATSTRVFRIAGPPLDAIVTEIAARVNRAAPHVRLEWVPQTQSTYTQVIDEQLDLAYGNARAPLPEGLRDHVLPELKRYVFARKDHPGLADWSLETWLHWPHIVVALPTTASRDAVERCIADAGLVRNVGLHLVGWSAIAPALLRTDMLANQNGIVFLAHPDPNAFRALEPPIPLPRLALRVLWNARLEADPARVWLRRIVIDSLEDLIRRAGSYVDALGPAR